MLDIPFNGINFNSVATSEQSQAITTYCTTSPTWMTTSRHHAVSALTRGKNFIISPTTALLCGGKGIQSMPRTRIILHLLHGLRSKSSTSPCYPKSTRHSPGHSIKFINHCTLITSWIPLSTAPRMILMLPLTSRTPLPH